MSENLTIHKVGSKDRGMYICEAKNILRSATDRAQLMVVSRLRFKVRPPQEVTPLIGSTVRLPCVAESYVRTTITWTRNGKPSLPVDSNVLLNGTLVLQNIKKSHEGPRDFPPRKDGILHPRSGCLGTSLPLPQSLYGRTLTSQPKCFGLIDYQICLAMELRWWALPAGSAINNRGKKKAQFSYKNDHFFPSTTCMQNYLI